jgi:hypothetical protein
MIGVRSRKPPELSGPPFEGWGSTRRVTLPGGGFMYVPTTFIAVGHPKDRLQQYVWSAAVDGASVGIELITYHRAMRLGRSQFGDLINEAVEQHGCSTIGDLETVTVNGCATLYGLARLTQRTDGTSPQFGAYARILTRHAGLLFEATHADLQGVDRLARAVLATLLL